MFPNSKFLTIFVLISAIVLVEFLQCANAHAEGKKGKPKPKQTKPNHHAAVPPGSPTHGKAKTQPKPAAATPAGAGKKKTQKPTAVKPPSSPTHKAGQKHDQKEMEFLKKALNEVIAKHYEQKHSAKDQQHHKEHAGKEDLKAFEKDIIDQLHKKCNEEGQKKGAKNKKNYAKAAKLPIEELKKLLESDIQTAFKKNEILEKEVEKAVKEAIKTTKNKKKVEAGKIQGNIQSTAMNNVIKEMKKHEHDVGKLDKNDKAHVKKLIETEIGKEAHKKEIEKLKKDAEVKHASKSAVHQEAAKEKAKGKKKGGKHEVPSIQVGGTGHGNDSHHHGHGSAPPSPTGKLHNGGNSVPSSHTDKSHKNPKFDYSGVDHVMIPEPHSLHQKSENHGNHNVPEQHNEEEYAHLMDSQNGQNESSDSYNQFDGMDEEQRNESDDDSLPLTRGNRNGASFGGIEDDVEQRGEESARSSAEVHEQEDEGPDNEAIIQRSDNSVDPDDEFGGKPQKAEDEEDGKKELGGGLDHPEEEEIIPSETNPGDDDGEVRKNVDVNEDDETKQNVEVPNEKETESVDEVSGGIKNPAEGNVNKDGDDIE